MDDNPGISLFQGNGLNIDSALQNQEEDEDLEDQKRRQEEIQNFLTKAMDEFNYDDQSTIHSSTNVSVDNGYHPVENQEENVLFNKYTRNTNLDDQLKVLYEIRVKEVKELMEKVGKLEMDIEKQKDIHSKKCILLEADKNKAKISLEQSQKLLLSKSEEIDCLGHEVVNLQSQVAQLEKQIDVITEEYSLCKQTNKELMDQLEIMHSGLTSNTISDRVLKEQHHAEVSQMHHLLDVANTKLYRKEKECQDYVEKLNAIVKEKDQIVVEKTTIINKLAENLESAQQQCHDLLEVINKVSQENKTLKLSSSELQDSARVMNLTEKMEYINALQKELAKAQDKHRQHQDHIELIERTCNDLKQKLKHSNEEKEKNKIEVETWKSNYSSLEENFRKADEEICSIQKQIQGYRGKLEDQQRYYEDKIIELEATLAQYEIKLTQDTSAQVSFNFGQSSKYENDEKQKLRNDLLIANEEIAQLHLKLTSAENEISKLQISSKLERERESLIRNLQEKAAQFEKVIKEKQLNPDRFSIGINTEDLNNEIDEIKKQYESDFVKRELEIRVNLKNDYDRRLEQIEHDLAEKLLQTNNVEIKKCTNCEELLHKLRKLEVVSYNKDENILGLKSQMKQDRNAVAGLLETWRDKFMDMEIEKKQLLTENLQIMGHCNELENKLKSYDVGTSKLYHLIKKECEETIKLWNKNMIENLQKYVKQQKVCLTKSRTKIDDISEQFDDEVATIEMNFLRKQRNLGNFKSTKR
nr:putative leucine-rich repeat-containing protein DDB_G0290503 [Onthophagus taurus]